MSQLWRSGAAGANPTPQLPIAIVVTPCSDDGAIIESQVACPSKWVWRSMKPGVTIAPSASISRDAGPGDGTDGGDDVVGDLDVAAAWGHHRFHRRSSRSG